LKGPEPRLYLTEQRIKRYFCDAGLKKAASASASCCIN
jgi:hypothetical protein